MTGEAEAETSASGRAYAWTRAMIIDGSLEGGSMISESDVSDLLGVSRTPVREAFLRLAAEGAMKLFPKRGALIVPITADDVRDVMEARLLIEPWAVAIVADGAAKEPLLAALRAHIETQRTSGRSSRQILEYQEADRSFHEAIVAAAANRVVDSFYRSLRDRQLRMGAAALVHNEERLDGILAEHEGIVAAIESGDGDEAERLVREHIEHTRDALGVRSAHPHRGTPRRSS